MKLSEIQAEILTALAEKGPQRLCGSAPLHFQELAACGYLIEHPLNSFETLCEITESGLAALAENGWDGLPPEEERS